jgi:GDP-L-fucose synthase
MNRDARIYIAGHNGLVGSALVRKLQAEGYTNLISRAHADLDLTRQAEVEAFFEGERPEYVFLAAAKVGGIWANQTCPAGFIYRNLAIAMNVIHAAWKTEVKGLLFLGSSCIYPRECPQPIKEKYLLSGSLEVTNEPYAVAKIAGVKMCEFYNRQYGTNFMSVMPTNLYGPHDNFDLETSHVLPALIRKFYLAKLATEGNWEAVKENESRFGPIPDEIRAALGLTPDISQLTPGSPQVILWGSGNPRREFLHVDDLADACLFLIENFSASDLEARDLPNSMVNIGCGKDMTIKELALTIKEIVGFEGDMLFDTTKPDGTPQKLLDISTMEALGWSPRISLRDGIRQTYEWWLENVHPYYNAP